MTDNVDTAKIRAEMDRQLPIPEREPCIAMVRLLLDALDAVRANLELADSNAVLADIALDAARADRDYKVSRAMGRAEAAEQRLGVMPQILGQCAEDLVAAELANDDLHAYVETLKTSLADAQDRIVAAFDVIDSSCVDPNHIRAALNGEYSSGDATAELDAKLAELDAWGDL